MFYILFWENLSLFPPSFTSWNLRKIKLASKDFFFLIQLAFLDKISLKHIPTETLHFASMFSNKKHFELFLLALQSNCGISFSNFKIEAHWSVF